MATVEINAAGVARTADRRRQMTELALLAPVADQMERTPIFWAWLAMSLLESGDRGQAHEVLDDQLNPGGGVAAPGVAGAWPAGAVVCCANISSEFINVMVCPLCLP